MHEPPSYGMAVEIGHIDRELGRLWDSSEDTKTRASMINLVVYTEDAAAMAENTQRIAAIASEHACRAILILADCAAPESSAKAWITAHCHVQGNGGRQICSEQITFELKGSACGALPNIVFSHLDSDLPLALWWQGEFCDPLDEKLWAWVDRLIFDSRAWNNPASQFALTEKIANLRDARAVLCDLNWARLYPWRFALASLFDSACALPSLSRLTHVEICHAPGSETTAILLLGWLAAQLGWTSQSLLSQHDWQSANGQRISFALVEAPGSDLSHVSMTAPDATFEISREKDFFHLRLKPLGMAETNSTMSVGRERVGDTLLAELSRGGRHLLYKKAVVAAEPLLSALPRRRDNG